MTRAAPRARARGWWAAPAAGLLAAVMLALASGAAWPLTVDIGQRDSRFVEGFHEPERFGDTLFRWTTGDSRLALPRPPAGASVLTLRLLNGYPDGQPDPRLEISADGRPLGGFAVTKGSSGVRRYSLLMPTSDGADWAVRLRLAGTTYEPPADPRPLGAVVDWARVTPTLRTGGVPPLLTLAAAFALGALVVAAGLLLGAGPAGALAASVAVCALVALGAAERPLEVLPFLVRLASVPAIAVAALLLARLLLPARTAAGGPAVRGEDLPALCALLWWMLPVFQGVQVLDGASIGVGVETLWLGAAAALLTAAAAGAAWARGRGAAPEDRRRSVAAWSLGGLAAGAALHLGYAIWYAFTRSGKDFWILFKGARDWARGGSLYDLEAVMTNHVGAVFKVPPFYGMLFTPFVFQDGLQILLYHRIINVALLVGTAAVWLLMFRPRPTWWGLAAIVILLNNRPLADTIAYGQIDLMLLFLLSCALWALRGAEGAAPRRAAALELAAGALVALGALFKIYPVILLAFFVLKGRWRAVAGFALGMLALNGLAVAVMGWEMHRVYLFEVLPRIGGTTSWVENQTISAFLARLTDVPFDAHLYANRALGLLGTAISGLASLAACWLCLRPAAARSTAFALQYCLFLLLMVLAVPAAWMHYETLLVLPFGAALLHLRGRDVPLGRAAALALGFALVGYGNQWSFNGTTVMGFLTVLGISYKFYGMLLLGAVMVGSLLEERAPAAFPAIARLVPRLGQR